MKKTLLLTLEFPPQKGGIARYISELAKRCEAGSMTVLTEPRKDSAVTDSTMPFPVMRRRLLARSALVWPRWFPMLYHVWRAVRKESIKLILAGEVLPGGTAAYFLSKIMKIPYGVFTHGLDILGPQRIRNVSPIQSMRKTKLMRRVLRSASIVIANSLFTKRILVDLGIDERKIIVVSPCTNIDAGTDDQNAERIIRRYRLEGKRVILSVGRLIERKGHDRVIEAMRGVLKQFPNALYAIIGDGPRRIALEKLAHDAGISKYVFFAGSVPDDELQEWYRLCEVFILASREIKEKGDVEGFGIVFLEAGAYRKPVIGGRSGGIIEAIIHRKTGLLVDPENPSEIRNALCTVLQDTAYAKSMGKNGHDRVQHEFTWDAQAQRLYDALKHL